MTEVVPRRLHYGGATPTALAAPLQRTDMSFTIKNDTGWPKDHTLVGSFIVTIDRGTTREERVLCERITGNVITIAADGRGYDMTTPVDHGENASVEHTFSAIEADEMNIHILGTTGVHGTDGKVLGVGDLTTFLGTYNMLPPGMLMPFAGTNVPGGWLLCDGREVPKTTYPLLFGAIGDLYGAATDAANFKLPDFRDRTVVGAAAPTGRASGSPTSSVTLTAANLPPHFHTTPELGHGGGAVTGNGSHVHGVHLQDRDHGHTFNTAGNGAHNHRLPWTIIRQGSTAQPADTVSLSNGSTLSGVTTNGGEGWHDHSGTTNGVPENQRHSHGMDPASHSHGFTQPNNHPAGQTGSGNGTSTEFTFSVVQPHYPVPMLIKCDQGVTP